MGGVHLFPALIDVLLDFRYLKRRRCSGGSCAMKIDTKTDQIKACLYTAPRSFEDHRYFNAPGTLFPAVPQKPILLVWRNLEMKLLPPKSICSLLLVVTKISKVRSCLDTVDGLRFRWERKSLSAAVASPPINLPIASHQIIFSRLARFSSFFLPHFPPLHTTFSSHFHLHHPRPLLSSPHSLNLSKCLLLLLPKASPTPSTLTSPNRTTRPEKMLPSPSTDPTRIPLKTPTSMSPMSTNRVTPTTNRFRS